VTLQQIMLYLLIHDISRVSYITVYLYNVILLPCHCCCCWWW